VSEDRGQKTEGIRLGGWKAGKLEGCYEREDLIRPD